MNGLKIDIRLRYSSGFLLDARFETEALLTCLFGRSGSGKSSVLASVAGLVSPDEGCISLRGRTLFSSQERVNVPVHRRNIGFVFQDHLLFPHLTVQKNLQYGWRRQRSKRTGLDLESVVRVLELQGILQQYPRTLSGGQKQRVALGRALLCQPEMLLMDEPLTGLDDTLKSKILGYVERAVHEWRIPTLYVTHSVFEVQRLAQRVIVLDNGSVVDQGTAEEVLQHAPVLEREERIGNLLRVRDLQQDDNGDWHGKVGQQLLSLPAGSYPNGEVLIRFAADAVALSRLEPTPSSIRNRLHGTVEHLVELADRMLIQIDVGQPLWAEITHEAQRELQLRPGDSVTCMVKALAMQTVG